jgi:hypothetical protein
MSIAVLRRVRESARTDSVLKESGSDCPVRRGVLESPLLKVESVARLGRIQYSSREHLLVDGYDLRGLEIEYDQHVIGVAEWALTSIQRVCPLTSSSSTPSKLPRWNPQCTVKFTGVPLFISSSGVPSSMTLARRTTIIVGSSPCFTTCTSPSISSVNGNPSSPAGDTSRKMDSSPCGGYVASSTGNRADAKTDDAPRSMVVHSCVSIPFAPP